MIMAVCVRRDVLLFSVGLGPLRFVNILSILQQWQITRMIEGAKAAPGQKR